MSANAQTTKAAARSSGGRSIFLSPAHWSTLHGKLSDPFFRRLAHDNRLAIAAYQSKQGVSLVDMPIDLRGDTRRASALHYRVLKGRLLRAAIAMYVNQDESAWDFASETIDFLLQPEFWTPCASGCRIRHFDLKMADLLYDACFALDTFGHLLDDERRGGLYERIVAEGLGAYLRGWDAEEWWRNANFNWSAATHGNAGLAALLLEEIDPVLSGNIMEKVRAGLDTLISHFPSDGWWTEGCGYHTTMIDHLSDFVIPLHRLHGDDLGLGTNKNWIEGVTTRRYSLAPDGGVYNFSNCSPHLAGWFSPQLYWWSGHLNRPEMVAFEDSICKQWSDTYGVYYDVESFLYRPANPPPTRPEKLAPLRHFRGLDWVTSQEEKTWLAFRSGHNGGNHNNLDLGHFILGRNETRFLIDPGYGLTHTAQHNAVTVHGKDQAVGATAHIRQCTQRPGFMHLACDLQAAYPHILDRHVRTLALVDDTHLFVIDQLQGRNGVRVSAAYHFQTALPVEVVDGGCEITGPEGQLLIASLSRHDTPAISAYPSQTEEVSAMKFHADADRTEEISVFLITFGAASAPAITWNRASLTATIATRQGAIVLDLTGRQPALDGGSSASSGG